MKKALASKVAKHPTPPQHSTSKGTSRNQQPNYPNKHELCLLELLRAGTAGISKLSMLPAYGETALPTTISELGRHRQLRICRELRPHQHRHGGIAHFSHYWLADLREAVKAAELINQLRAERSAALIGESELDTLLLGFPRYDPLEVA